MKNNSINIIKKLEVINLSGFYILPRFIRLKNAAAYLGMDRHRFNDEVRPDVIEIPIGKQGIAFDRLDLDAWAEHYKQCTNRPKMTRRGELWVEKQQVLEKEASIGTLINKSSGDEFEKALVQLRTRKRRQS